MFKKSVFKKTAAYIVFSALFFSYAFAGEFDEFMKGQQPDSAGESKDFLQYKKDMDQQFNAYKRIVQEEYARYRDQILKKWAVAEMSGKKKWVEYSPDFTSRKIVDFENAYIEISIIVSKPGDNDPKVIDNLLTDLLLEDEGTAFKRDIVSQNIEKRITNNSKNLESAKIPKTPILTKALTGTSTPTPEKVKTLAADLQKKGTVIITPSRVKNSKVITAKIPLPSTFIQKKAEEYKPLAHYYAGERKIDAALVLAVIHTESAFNPMARSYVPAYGLMQIVPKSAGLDASEFVYGRQRLLSPSFLYNKKNNINMGTAYIYLLYYKYLKKIENSKSRLYCTIAAYNTGPGNVARAFTGSTNISKAAEVINQMPPDMVYLTLEKKLPYKETRKYITTVSGRQALYRR